MIFKFEPLYFERVWGGRALEMKFGREIPKEINIGESWDIVDRVDFQSILSPSCGKSTTLRELIRSNPEKIMGPRWDLDRQFPLLVKWLDCTDRLSLQVHPPSKVARALMGEPKTENWYIVQANENACLFIGLKKGKSKLDFIQALEEENLESVCHRIQSKQGDSLLVESGSMHAIDGGNLILEIQQNSDTTYRVYDWGRKGTDGQPRKLHLEESLQCINFNEIEPNVVSTSQSPMQVLADCEHFRIRKFKVKKEQSIELKGLSEQCMILNPIDSEICVGDELLSAGELGLSPYNEGCNVKFLSSGTLLVTDNFYKPNS